MRKFETQLTSYILQRTLYAVYQYLSCQLAEYDIWVDLLLQILYV
jgi:hypothetical protein